MTEEIQDALVVIEIVVQREWENLIQYDSKIMIERRNRISEAWETLKQALKEKV